MLRVTFRLAGEGDRRPIFEWRNHQDVRRYFFDSASVAWEDHTRWFDGVLTDRRRHLLIAEDDQGVSVGVIRFDEAEAGDTAEVSVYVVPGRQGQGWGSEVLGGGLAWLRSHTSVRTVRARVREENVASIRLFAGAGFSPLCRVFEYDLTAAS